VNLKGLLNALIGSLILLPLHQTVSKDFTRIFVQGQGNDEEPVQKDRKDCLVFGSGVITT